MEKLIWYNISNKKVITNNITSKVDVHSQGSSVIVELMILV